MEIGYRACDSFEMWLQITWKCKVLIFKKQKTRKPAVWKPLRKVQALYAILRLFLELQSLACTYPGEVEYLKMTQSLQTTSVNTATSGKSDWKWCFPSATIFCFIYGGVVVLAQVKVHRR